MSSAHLRKNTLRFFRLLGALVFVGTLAIATRASGQDAKSTIRLHSPGPSILSLAFEVAKEEGFYRQESVNVDLITMASGAGVQALVAGSVDASQILGLTLRAAINRGAPLKIVMVFNDQPTYRLMAKKEIGSFADLKGKIVASSSPGASADTLLQRLWKNAASFRARMSRSFIPGVPMSPIDP